MTPQQLRDAAYEVLIRRGPMKSSKIAKEFGLANARGLSMALQWDQSSVQPRGIIFNGGKWCITTSKLTATST